MVPPDHPRRPAATGTMIAVGTLGVVALGGWMWSRRSQPQVDEHTRARLAMRVVAPVMSTAADITVRPR